MQYFNEDIGRNDTIDFDPQQHETMEGAAKALYAALCVKAKAIGMNPDSEVFIRTPEQNAAAGYGACWHVSWEAGPFDWAIGASFNCSNSPHWYTEPYYGFDLDFTN